MSKTYYSVAELLAADWFPKMSRPTLMKIIKSGRLKTANIGQGETNSRYQIHFEDAMNFIKYSYNKQVGDK